MTDIATLSWLKRYLMSKRENQFYELRNWKNYGLINRENTNIAGYHLSNGIFDCNNEIKALYEYIERLACQKVPQAEIRIGVISDERLISFDDLGFDWTEKQFQPLKEKIRYVEGFSLKTGKKFFVPSVVAYYLDNNFDEWDGFVGNSNGNALGTQQDDAIDRGILEFVERDKFIKYWYLGEGKLLKLPNKMFTPQLQQKINYFYKHGYQVDFFCIENQPDRIFLIWCLFRSIDYENVCFSFSGFGADVCLEQAIEKSFCETSAIYFSHINRKQITKRNNKNKIDVLEECIMYYLSYDREKDFELLFKATEDFKPTSFIKSTNKEKVKKIALDFYKDIICVPIQNKVLTDLGLYEVKVIGIGGNNMYFECSQEVMNKGRIPGPSPLA